MSSIGHRPLGSFLGSFASIGVLLLTAGTATATPITTWGYSGAQLRYLQIPSELGPPPQILFVDYDQPPTIGASAFTNGIKLFGTGDLDRAFSLTGEQYVPTPAGAPSGYRGNQLLITGTGTIDGAAWQHPDDFIRTTFNFGFEFGTGLLELIEVRTVFFLLDSNGAFLPGAFAVGGTEFGEPFGPGAEDLNFSSDARFGADISAAVGISWFISFSFDWTGLSPDDTLAFHIPQNSVDIEAMTVPVPGAAPLAGLAVLAAIRRRRA